eukprot:TRINITY_DN4032_c0_g1_i1.p1 TRINITY_DN4032_c0_g1~~TRINITY_DN4032_c0_g1_i1.p1  ORF type:complete len:284 (-),score=113.76 TRINITY_DN4032_c0_g1_i1:33-884(-)
MSTNGSEDKTMYYVAGGVAAVAAVVGGYLWFSGDDKEKKNTNKSVKQSSSKKGEVVDANVPAKAFVIVGPSGVGKSTLIRKVRAMFDEKATGFSCSHTTRAPRQNPQTNSEEVDGVDYHFTDHETFQKMVDNNEFLEHATVHGNSYGTSKQAVASIANNNQVCILDIDVQGAQQVYENSRSDSSSNANLPEFVFIFIKAPSSEELERRLRGRKTETEDKIKKRLDGAKREMEFLAYHLEMFNHVITNDDLEKATQKLVSIVAPVMSACGFEMIKQDKEEKKTE